MKIRFANLGKVEISLVKRDLNLEERMAEQKVFNEEHVKGLIDDVGGSFKNILKVIQWMRRVFGQSELMSWVILAEKHHSTW